MARSIDDIQQSMISAIQADPVLSLVCTSTSKVAIWRLMTRIFAACAWSVEVLFDTLKQEVNDIIANLKPHSLRWYANKAKDFQYGFSLEIDSDKYDNTGFTDDEIETSKVVQYSAVTEGDDGKLRIKIAGITGEDLAPISAPQLTAFTEFMRRVKDAGVRILIVNQVSDKLKLDLKIYFNPLILDGDGQRIDGADATPVQSAVKNFLKNQPFNGVFVLAYLVDALQQVDGVVIPHVSQCLTKFGAFAFTSVNVQYSPDSGYLRFESDDDLTIEFIPQTQLQ
jgi:hypothetical protein